MFLLASVSLFFPLHTLLIHTHTHTHTLLSVSPVHQRAVMFGVWPRSQGNQDAVDAGKKKKKNLSELGSHIISVSVFSFARLKTTKWDDSASSKRQLHLLLQFCTNKCVHCETRQISSEWSTCIKMSLWSKINMLMEMFPPLVFFK